MKGVNCECLAQSKGKITAVNITRVPSNIIAHLVFGDTDLITAHVILLNFLHRSQT